jgi:histidine triad (HIT) family protein
MFNHEPKDYTCPFCAFLGGRENDFNTKQDVIYQNDFATAFISPTWWVNNAGHALVVSNQHYENIYSIPDEQIAEVYKVVKKVAVAIRSTYDCDGTSTRQHNEPAGDQDVWHFHVQVFPRYTDDKLYQNHDQRGFVGTDGRAPYAERLQEYFAEHHD